LQCLGIDLQRAKEIFHALQSFAAPPSELESQRQWHLQGGQGRTIIYLRYTSNRSSYF
jgi:hypothetical protein